MQAYQTANLQGAKLATLQELLDAVDAGPAAPAPPKAASTDHLMTVMAQWRVAMAEVEIQRSRNPRRR